MNKLPYIRQKDLKAAMTLAHEIKEREGWNSFIFFRKMILCAMYGEMMHGKIPFHIFVQSAQKEYTKIKLNDRTIYHFWDFKTSHTPQGQKDVFFNVLVKEIEELPIRRIERILIAMFQLHYVDRRFEYNYIELPYFKTP